MPKKAYRCLVELNVHAVTAPGVWLPARDDIYVSVCLLGQYRRSNLVSPVFPVLLHEKLRFDRTFYLALDHFHVVDLLGDEEIYIEMVQLSDLYDRGIVLATYSCNAREFLYPFPSLPPSYATQEREVLMKRTKDFPGISPKLEFSCKTVVQQLPHYPMDDTYIGTATEDELQVSRSIRRASRRSRSRSRTRSMSGVYDRPTLSTIYRSRSPSPSRHLATRMSRIDLEDDIDDRPPFVVRKLSPNPIERMPGRDTPRSMARAARRSRSRSVSPSRRRSRSRARSRSCSPGRVRFTSGNLDTKNLGPCKICRAHAPQLDCLLCRLHRKYFGYSYAGHVWCHYPEIHRKINKVVSDDYYAKLHSSDDTDQLVDTSLHYAPLPRSRSPVLYRSALRDRFAHGSGYYTTGTLDDLATPRYSTRRAYHY